MLLTRDLCFLSDVPDTQTSAVQLSGEKLMDTIRPTSPAARFHQRVSTCTVFESGTVDKNVRPGTRATRQEDR